VPDEAFLLRVAAETRDRAQSTGDVIAPDGVCRPIFGPRSRRTRTASPSGSRRRSELVSGFERKAPKTLRCWRDRREKNKARVDLAPHDPTETVYY
jgi:hypothetical protein